MNDAEKQFRTALDKIFVRYPLGEAVGDAAQQLNARKNLQLLFRQEQQYRLGALLTKWSDNDPAISENTMAKIYFQCVFLHFKTMEYYK